MSDVAYRKMKDYYDRSDIPQQVTSSLKEGAVAEVQFEGDPETYMMIKEKGRSYFRVGKPNKPEIYMKFNEGAVDYLMGVEGAGKPAIQEYAARFSQCILTPTKERKIQFKLCTNVLTAGRKGYFGMMLKGGKTAINLVSTLGIKIPKRFLDMAKND